MKKYNLILLISVIYLLSLTKILQAQDHQLFTDVLKKYVINGLVDYKNLKNDKTLDKYLTELSNTNPDNLNRNQKLAFWINAYNAFTLQIVRDNYPIESITELHTGGKVIGYLLGKTVWDKEFIPINNKKYSLNDIEHKILRKMSEPRIHFAIVCASISCPQLLNEAYEADKIDSQLENQTRKFINDKTRNHFDLKNRKANISEIFNWFGEDFGKTDENILKFISNYVSDDISKDIKTNISKWNISFNDYNWNLNELK
ncbi:Hypothetical protein IALB_1974 [Ignavibacterium album JCM 16511]|uniref:DUF547 domain-containing protein n=1 Tax=Ignavibacterium album (strain DSM 19864 / JCM 16511 / NBRC 101810 / Mat9-16) TaxID=945713 RepID=I0AL23_IGNAJ|nr:DUF547 domain-containing protein [Ignavibacterium album]AFH49680.1 Hypothetical protein IALB_1974 [Ignavibacterium album JCM 16511]